ncbi:MAG: extracellular solute-binding protein [Epulopiscium sp.]|nr:extracellular solute-binding protein [Candidatus Epulonipiscium sp.]
MKVLKKAAALLLTLSVIVTAAGCGQKPDENPTEPTTKVEDEIPNEKQEAEEDVRDLGGREIIIGNWWEPENPAEPQNQYEEDQLAYREEIQKKYNFKIKTVNIGGWGEIQELFMTSVMAGDPAADVFVLDTSFVAQPLAAGLFYPVSDLGEFDFTNDKWNKQVVDSMTYNGKVYGFSPSKRLEPRTGVFFNKRLFEEAGLSPELPYELQKNGEWTWDKFKELSKTLTRDKDNDGVMDTYALASFSKDFFTAVAFANDAKYIGKDDSGLFYNATGEPNFLEAMQWARSLYDEGYTMPQPEDSEWNWFEAAFHDGQVAMRVAEEYVKGSLGDMEDDWGFVLFPAGPKGKMTTVFRENILVIPSSAKNPEEIAFAFNLWNEPIPGYDDSEDWKNSFYPAYRDERAVDETLSMMHDGYGILRLDPYVYGLETGDICYGLDAGTKTPAEAIEGVKQTWQALIDDANGTFK